LNLSTYADAKDLVSLRISRFCPMPEARGET
jgi:hypothetical protein